MNKKATLIIVVPSLVIGWIFLVMLVILSGIKLLNPDFIPYTVSLFILSLLAFAFLLSITRRYLSWIRNVKVPNSDAKIQLARLSSIILVIALTSVAGIFYYLSSYGDVLEMKSEYYLVAIIHTWMLLLVAGFVLAIWSISYLGKVNVVALISGLGHVMLLLLWWKLYDG